MYDMPAIPEFLKRVRTPTTPTNVTPPGREWVMPEHNIYKERRLASQRSIEVLEVVRCLVRDNTTTLTKLRKILLESGYDFSDYDIKSGLKQLTKQRLVVLRKRTWCWVGS